MRIMSSQTPHLDQSEISESRIENVLRINIYNLKIEGMSISKSYLRDNLDGKI